MTMSVDEYILNGVKSCNRKKMLFFVLNRKLGNSSCIRICNPCFRKLCSKSKLPINY